MSTSRPIHLDLTRMKFPPMAIVSIMHRASGVILFLLLPFVLYLLEQSLVSQTTFMQLQQTFASPVMKIMMGLLISAVSFHFLAGIRHMLMDCGVAEGLKSARASAYLLMGLEGIIVLMLGVWLW